MKSPTTKQQKTQAFQRTMSQARSHLNPVSRLFSLFIHLRPLEHLSSTLGATLARPLAILCGALGMVIAIVILYGTAKTVGYAVSGSEGIIGFILGWSCGVIIDVVRSLLSKRRKQPV